MQYIALVYQDQSGLDKISDRELDDTDFARLTRFAQPQSRPQFERMPQHSTFRLTLDVRILTSLW